jgi:diguanylate cyclase (GGDEF)-like protein
LIENTSLQSIENTTLESWPVSAVDHQTIDATWRFAVRQKGVSLDFHLEQFYRDQRLSLHFFDSFEELVHICHRHDISAILIGGKSEFFREVELVRTIKQNILLSTIPVLLFHPDPDLATLIAAYENGAEDFIHGEWIDKLVKVRISRAVERSRRDMAVNPSTALPGPGSIEREINRQLQLKERFAICYADLDNFKAFNDYYGYVYGDKIIRLTGRILRDIVFDLCPEGFVGHIAGDDFICVIPAEQVKPVCEWIIKCFDAFIPYRYDLADRERGFIETMNRRGEVEQFPILSISIGVIVNENGEFEHLGELSKMLADLKKATKAMPGSNYLVERRRKY